MSEFSDIFADAIGVIADTFGIAATYTPPGGSPVACAVLIDRDADAERQDFAAQARTAGFIVQVRASEVAAPARGGRFAAGAAIYCIVGEPVLDVASGAIWSCKAG